MESHSDKDSFLFIIYFIVKFLKKPLGAKLFILGLAGLKLAPFFPF
jgi:hypothetical protein